MIDWEVVVANALAVHDAAPCYYWLSFFAGLAPARIPRSVLERLEAATPRSTRNWDGRSLGCSGWSRRRRGRVLR